MKTINCVAAQDAAAATFVLTVTMPDALSKELMAATPSVKLHNNSKKLDVYEVNPVHTVTHAFNVVLQQPLQKTIVKGDTVYFDLLP